LRSSSPWLGVAACIFGHLKSFQKLDFCISGENSRGTLSAMGRWWQGGGRLVCWYADVGGLGIGECWRSTRRVGVGADDGSTCCRLLRWKSSFGIFSYRVESPLWTLHRSFRTRRHLGYVSSTYRAMAYKDDLKNLNPNRTVFLDTQAPRAATRGRRRTCRTYLFLPRDQGTHSHLAFYL